MNKRFLYSIICIFCIIGIALLYIQSCSGKMDNTEVVARVGNTILTRNTMIERMSWEGFRPGQESDFVERWVNRELLFQESKRLGLDRHDELKWELELVEKEFVIQKLLERMFAEKIRITENEILAYYEQNKNQFIVEEDEIRILHILTKNREDAVLAHQEIRAGKLFQEVAQDRSIGIFRENGGDIGYIRQGDVSIEIWRKARSLNEDQLSAIFRSSHGYHVIKVIKKRFKGSVKELEEIQSEILQRLRISKEGSVYYDLVYQLQNKIKVYVSVPSRQARDSDTIHVDDQTLVEE